jgi:O-antigen/teichoic acid export membrane protein
MTGAGVSKQGIRVKTLDPSLSRNAAANVTGLFVHLAVAFFLSPFIIHSLGDARYGAWSLVGEMVGYYGVLDLGLKHAVGYFVAHYLARAEHERLSWSICTAFWTLLGMGVVLALLGVGLGFAFPRLFLKGEMAPGEITAAIIITSVAVGISMAMELFSQVLGGCRRVDLVNFVEIVTRLLTAGGIYVALTSGGGLVAISLVQTAGRIVTWIVSYRLAQEHAGPFSLHPRAFRRTELRALSGLSAMNLLNNIGQIVISRTDLVVIGAFLDVKAVAYYNIGRLLVEYAGQANYSVMVSFRPHLTHLYSRGDFDGFRRLFLMGTRISALLAIPVAACMLSFGRPLLALWVGSGYVDGAASQRSDIVMAILILAYLPQWQQTLSWQAIFATGRYRYLTALTLAQAVANIAITLLLVQWYGLIGVAVGRLIPSAFVNLVLVPRHVLGRFGIAFSPYFRQGVGRGLLIALVMLGLTQAAVNRWYPSSWALLLAEVAICGSIQLALSWSIGLTAEDRRLGYGRLRDAMMLLRGTPGAVKP